MKTTCPHCFFDIEIDPETHAALQGHSHFQCPSCNGLVPMPFINSPRPAAPVRFTAAAAIRPSTPSEPPASTLARTDRGTSRNLLILGSAALLTLGGLVFLLAGRSGNIFNSKQRITNQIINNTYFQKLISSGKTTSRNLHSLALIRPCGDGFIGISREEMNWEQALELAKLTGSEVLPIGDTAASSKPQLSLLKTTFGVSLKSMPWVRQVGQASVTDGNEVVPITSLESTRKVALQWTPGAAGETTDPALATKEKPFQNSLGMRFVPVPITGGPTSGKRLLFSVWTTRVQDYGEYVMATGQVVEKPAFLQTKHHPAAAVSWDDAKAFCAWLSKKEGRKYRLPSDHEWSCAVGIGDREDAAATPADKNAKIADEYPWGKEWPQPKGVGNYWNFDGSGDWDGYLYTSPVGSFPANKFGLYDMGGNVWQWCEDSWESKATGRVFRGGSWNTPTQRRMLSSSRNGGSPHQRFFFTGFRCVIELPATP